MVNHTVDKNKIGVGQHCSHVGHIAIAGFDW